MVKKNLISVLVALIIMYLSLANSNTFDKVSLFEIPYIDKIAHFSMYFLLMSTIIILNRNSINSIKNLFLIALIPMFYGIVIEILQITVTSSRSGNFLDIVFNSAGILLSILLWILIKPLIKEYIR